MLNEQMTPFLKSWLHSVRMDQTADGTVMMFRLICSYMMACFGMSVRLLAMTDITGVAGWSDAIVWFHMICIR